MRTRKLPALAALMTAATLTLVSCGTDTSANDKIDGADGSKHSATPSASATDGKNAERPEITTPGFKTIFEGWKSADPKKQAVLHDGKERMRSLLAAIIKNDKEPDYVSFYSTGSALESGLEWVSGFQGKNLTLTGKSLYFNPVVEVKDGKATLEFCNEQNYGYSKNRKTGEVNREEPSPEGFVLYKTLLLKSKKGVWQTASTETDRGECTP